MLIIRITAPYFCCGAVLGSDLSVIKSAPIIKWMIGKSWKFIYDYCKKKKWKLEVMINESWRML